MTNNEIITKYYNFCQELKLKFGMDDDCFQMCILDLLETSNQIGRASCRERV